LYCIIFHLVIHKTCPPCLEAWTVITFTFSLFAFNVQNLAFSKNIFMNN
jgi:hypothetical protein